MSQYVVKLSNGEDIVCYVHKNKSSAETNKLKISSPLKMDTVTKETERGFVDSLALSRWIQPYSDENHFSIERHSIVIMTPASVGLTRYYQYVLSNIGQGTIEKIVPTSIPEILPNIVEVSGDDIEDDYKYQRDSFYNLVEKGSVAIDGILELAKESEHPRTYEVAGQLIKSVAEVAEKLGDLQEKMRKLKEVPSNAPKNVTNALFVGSTKELQKMLKDNIEDENT